MVQRSDKAQRRVQRRDRVTYQAVDLPPKREAPGGAWDCAGVFARDGVQVYEEEGETIREARPRSEVMKSADAMRALVLTLQHPGDGPDPDQGAQEITAENARDLWHGHVMDATPDWPQPGLLGGWVRAATADLQSAMTQGIVECSVGYTAVLRDPQDPDPAVQALVAELGPEPGVMHDGSRYDLIQTQIEPNHLAIVDQARAGSVARLRLDGVALMLDYVEKRGSTWAILSKEGETLETGFETEEAAKERLRQIEAAKYAKQASGEDAAGRYDSERGIMKLTIKRDGKTTTHELTAWLIDAIKAQAIEPAKARSDQLEVGELTIEGQTLVLPKSTIDQILTMLGAGAGPSAPEPMAEPMPMDAQDPMADEGMPPEPKADAEPITQAKIDAMVAKAIAKAQPAAAAKIADSVLATSRARANLERDAQLVLGPRHDFAGHDDHAVAVAVLKADESPRLGRAEQLAVQARKGDLMAAGRLRQMMDDALDRRRDALDSSVDLAHAVWDASAFQARTDAADDETPERDRVRRAKRDAANGAAA